MTMQINVDPAALTQEQREAVAGFILAYPGKSCGGHCHTGAEIHDATATAGVAVLTHVHHAPVASGETGPALDPEIAALVKDDGEFQASVAFGHGSAALDADAAKLNAVFGQGAADPTLADVGLAPAAAFGSAPAPLPHGATAAPSIAVAAPSLTAPAVMPGTTSTATSTVPAPPAPTAAQTTNAPLAAPSTPASGVEVDKHGLPWDGRIHAGTKRKNADGSWTAKRGVDPALVAQVEAELRQVMGAAPAAPLAPAAAIPAQPAATVTTPTPGVASSAVAVPVPPIAPPPPAPSAPVAPVAGAAPTMPAAPNVAPAGDVPQDARQQFVGLVGRASAAIQGGKVTQAEVNQICADSGIPALPLLANRLDLVATVASRIDALIAARGQ